MLARLTVNERKTRIAKLPEDHFDFLGYTTGRLYGKNGVPYLGTRPSKKAVHRLLAMVRDETLNQWKWQAPAKRGSEKWNETGAIAMAALVTHKLNGTWDRFWAGRPLQRAA